MLYLEGSNGVLMSIDAPGGRYGCKAIEDCCFGSVVLQFLHRVEAGNTGAGGACEMCAGICGLLDFKRQLLRMHPLQNWDEEGPPALDDDPDCGGFIGAAAYLPM